MQQNNGVTTIFEKDFYAAPQFNNTTEVTTASDITYGKNQNTKFKESGKKFWETDRATAFVHYLTLGLLGLLAWSVLWSTWSSSWAWHGPWFRLCAVPIVAWASGLALQEFTTLPPLLAALLTGILARNLDILDMRDYTHIDALLRKIFPVVILGKASLGWNVSYMKTNWLRVATLGMLPWTAEVVTLATCTWYFLELPWLWGFLLGSIYASVSCAVVMPSVVKHGAGGRHNWAQLVCTAGGTDTALSVGFYGIFYSIMFFEANDTYRYIKAALTLFAGTALGVSWGSLAKFVPRASDRYVTQLRILLVLLGGLAANFLTLKVGWGGTGGVAVLVCNATAATHWAHGANDAGGASGTDGVSGANGWKLNHNPASTAYRVMWSALEPILFAYTGTFFVMDGTMIETMLLGFAILLICLFVRLSVAALVCWDLTLRERVFVCCTWIPKSIVEAVLCPLALNTVLSNDTYSEQEKQYAEKLMQLMIQAILITTPIGFLLTNHLGPVLLKKGKKEQMNDLDT